MYGLTCQVLRISRADNRAGVRHVACALSRRCPLPLPFQGVVSLKAGPERSEDFLFLIYKSVGRWHNAKHAYVGSVLQPFQASRRSGLSGGLREADRSRGSLKDSILLKGANKLA